MPAITPDQVELKRQENLPEAVFDAFNEAIAEGISANGSVTIKQDTIARSVATRLMITVDKVFDRNLLDVEKVYRAAGWKVEHEQPCQGEDFSAFFRFSKA